MDFLYHIFFACLRLRFLDVETSTGRRRPVPDVCRQLCSIVCCVIFATSVVVAKCGFWGLWCQTELICVRNPDLDDRIFDSLLTSMAAVQAGNVQASFLFVSDLNGHHQEWGWVLQPQTVAVLQFLTLQRYLIAISWLVRPMHVVEHLTSDD